MSKSTNSGSPHRPDPEFGDKLPKLKAHFFYTSSLPIDDPLSPIPNTSATEFKSLKHPLRPLSAVDNEALEKAWRDLLNRDKVTLEKRNKNSLSISGSTRRVIPNDESIEKFNFSPWGRQNKGKTVCADLPIRTKQYEPKSFQNSPFPETDQNYKSHLFKPRSLPSTDTEIESLRKDCIHVLSEGERWSSAYQNGTHNVYHDISEHPKTKQPHIESYTMNDNNSSDTTRLSTGIQSEYDHSPNDTRDENSAFVDQTSKCTRSKEISFCDESRDVNDVSIDDIDTTIVPSNYRTWEPRKTRESLHSDININHCSPKCSDYISQSHTFHYGDAGTTGNPFLKLPSRPSSPSTHVQAKDGYNCNDGLRISQSSKAPRENFKNKSKVVSNNDLDTTQVQDSNALRVKNHCCEVTVGISRLHLVILPTLQMKPIYWSSVNDTAPITRGTWFYQDTMYPVEPVVANQLEFGYRQLEPWTQTWKDELQSALAVGAAGEEKITYRLWPDEKEKLLNNQYENLRFETLSDPYSAAEFFDGEIAAEGKINTEAEGQEFVESKTNPRKYSTAQIIYKDSCHAFILKTSLQPSSYYGRKPLQKIQKGINVGIPVLRGFNWKMWNRLHPSKKLASDANASISDGYPSPVPVAKFRVKATDLILVVHGIGQKLSERVESFNFTHAVNEFRRSLNVEMINGSVNRALRNDGVGIMVLPVNWRSNISFEDGGALMKDDGLDSSKMDYSLLDVTQKSLPAVRQVISDVMLDIPYYMSRHKPKMIQAVIQEANRVYRLWCKNNSHFEEEGRVHLIAHSLGSVMIMEILSKQPNFVPKMDLDSKKMNTECFDFKTTNCFFAGSPAGFFLLLEQSKLLPRRGMNKVGAQNSNDHNVTGEAGTFGCMALDNIYNVLHYNDPIAYRLNPTVDRKYAESIKEAQLPTTSTGLFESIGRAMRYITPVMLPNLTMEMETDETEEHHSRLSRSLSMIAHLPSNMEMEVHDFSREEIAERKFSLLNDNGQIDWYMNIGRGPLEIQYLNMLGAHSSYWINNDFVRLVLVECGREPGIANTLTSMRAVKVTRMAK